MRLPRYLSKIVMFITSILIVACSAGMPETVEVTRLVFEEPGLITQQVEVTRVVTEQVVVEAEVVEVTRIVTDSGIANDAGTQYQSTPAPLPTSPPLYMEVTATPVPETPVQNFEVNPFIPTTVDHLSTFSLDVDTGAYTLVHSERQPAERQHSPGRGICQLL